MKVMMTIHALKNIIQQNNSKSSSEKSLARVRIFSIHSLIIIQKNLFFLKK